VRSRALIGSVLSTLIDTGVAARNDNEHVLTFDGRMPGISNQGQASGGCSIVSIVPVDGQRSMDVPSWSPDAGTCVVSNTAMY
jgi:TolB protein